MGHYIRVLGKDPIDIPLDRLRTTAHPALIELECGSEEEWEQLILAHESGDEIATIEKNPVVPDALGDEEIQELIDEVSLHLPQSAASWLREYLPTVKVIYCFSVLNGTEVNDGWSRLQDVYYEIWSKAGGILQADGEGFSNEEGFHILWQFGDTVTGLWNMAVLTEGGNWQSFEMQLDNKSHRDAFCRGEVPVGARKLG